MIDAHVFVVGTQFNVYRKPDVTTVTVVEGSIAVLAGQPPPGVTGLPLDALRVNAGYQVRVDARGVLAQPTPVDVQQAVAWLQRQIAFEQRPLGEVAEEFNRYGSIPIEIDDAALRALPISGVFNAYDIDSFVAFLQTLDGVRVERTTARIRVFRVKSTEGMKRLRPLRAPRWKNANDSGAQPARDLRKLGFPRVLTRRGIRKTLA